jgi:cytochrome c oxidase subunit 3
MGRPFGIETRPPRAVWDARVWSDLGAPSSDDHHRGGRDGDPERREGLSIPSAQLGLWIFLGTVTMLFAGFTSAYMVRQAGPDWGPMPRPPILWINTGVLLVSSVLVEIGRRRPLAVRRWVSGATALGVLFLLGQLLAWRALRAQGIYLPTNPHSAFFYILTGVHGAHVVGGLIALLSVLALTWRDVSGERVRRRFSLCAVYWHFVGGLWLYLLLVLFIL